MTQPLTTAADIADEYRRNIGESFDMSDALNPEYLDDESTVVMGKSVPETGELVMTADFKGPYCFLPEGRQWTVHSTSGNDYVVTVWTDPVHGRMALCSCKASEFDLACKHIRFVQMADSHLTRVPVREILPVYAEESHPFLELIGATN